MTINNLSKHEKAALLAVKEAPMTMRIFQRRLRGYRALGYRVEGFDE